MVVIRNYFLQHKFENENMELYRYDVLHHMQELWNKWRGKLHLNHVKGKPMHEALRNVSNGVDEKDWEWLIKDHFSTEKLKV